MNQLLVIQVQYLKLIRNIYLIFHLVMMIFISIEKNRLYTIQQINSNKRKYHHKRTQKKNFLTAKKQFINSDYYLYIYNFLQFTIIKKQDENQIDKLVKIILDLKNDINYIKKYSTDINTNLNILVDKNQNDLSGKNEQEIQKYINNQQSIINDQENQIKKLQSEINNLNQENQNIKSILKSDVKIKNIPIATHTNQQDISHQQDIPHSKNFFKLNGFSQQDNQHIQHIQNLSQKVQNIKNLKTQNFQDNDQNLQKAINIINNYDPPSRQDQIIAEIKKQGQYLSLDASSFIRDIKSKSITNNLDIESINISPIKDKSNIREKSIICDKTSLQVILNEDKNNYILCEQDNNINIIGTINESLREESHSQSSIDKKDKAIEILKNKKDQKNSSSRDRDLGIGNKNQKEEQQMRRYNSLQKKHEKKLSMNILSPNVNNQKKKPQDIQSTPLSCLMKQYGTTVSKSKKFISEGPIFFDFVQNLKNSKRKRNYTQQDKDSINLVQSPLNTISHQQQQSFTGRSQFSQLKKIEPKIVKKNTKNPDYVPMKIQDSIKLYNEKNQKNNIEKENLNLNDIEENI